MLNKPSEMCQVGLVWHGTVVVSEVGREDSIFFLARDMMWKLIS